MLNYFFHGRVHVCLCTESKSIPFVVSVTISCPVLYLAVKVERQVCFLSLWSGKEVTQSKNVLASRVTCEISQKSDVSAEELTAGINYKILKHSHCCFSCVSALESFY